MGADSGETYIWQQAVHTYIKSSLSLLLTALFFPESSKESQEMWSVLVSGEHSSFRDSRLDFAIFVKCLAHALLQDYTYIFSERVLFASYRRSEPKLATGIQTNAKLTMAHVPSRESYRRSDAPSTTPLSSDGGRDLIHHEVRCSLISLRKVYMTRTTPTPNLYFFVE